MGNVFKNRSMHVDQMLLDFCISFEVAKILLDVNILPLHINPCFHFVSI